MPWPTPSSTGATPNPLERLNGVESDYYLAQDIAYPAKDGPLDTIDELLLIRDVTQDLFYNTLNEVFHRVRQ